MGLFRDMKEGFQAANVALDQAQALQANAAGAAVYSGGISGTAVVDSVADTGTVVNGAPVLELSMTVTVPGRAPYQVKHRQLGSYADARLQPGSVWPVKVSQQDPNQLMIG